MTLTTGLLLAAVTLSAMAAGASLMHWRMRWLAGSLFTYLQHAVETQGEPTVRAWHRAWNRTLGPALGNSPLWEDLDC